MSDVSQFASSGEFGQSLKDMSAYELIAHIFGLTYFIAWSLSFYP